MCVKFTDAEIAYIKESVENYSSEFDIYDDEQELKLKIKSEYKDTYLFRLINWFGIFS